MRHLPLASIAPFALAAMASASGQVTDPLITDRPSFSVSAATVPPGRLQFESGYTFSREEGTIVNDVGEVLARLGLTSQLELRFAFATYEFSSDTAGTNGGLDDIDVGAKIQIADPSSGFNLLRPAVVILVGTSIPTGSQGFSGEGLWPKLGLALGWHVTPVISVVSNLIAQSIQIDGDRFGQFAGSLLTSYALAERWAVYLEYFGLASKQSHGLDDGFVDGGLTFLANSDLQFDARAGLGLTDPDVNYFLGLGLAWRI